MVTKAIGSNPQIIPSFKLLINPACVTELSVLFFQVVSMNTLLRSAGCVDADSCRTKSRVSFTQISVSKKPTTEMKIPM
jgi:hypothetical protein